MDPVSGNLIFPMQSYLVRTRHHTILVDTCVGDHKKRQRPSWNMTTSGKFLADLAAAGVRPDAVDYVLCTHLHGDHVGWNTELRDGRWVPTFPNARYVFTRPDVEFFSSYKEEPFHAEAFADSVLPIIEAGQANIVPTDQPIYVELDEGIWLTPAPGHSPGSCLIHARSAGAHGIFSG